MKVAQWVAEWVAKERMGCDEELGYLCRPGPPANTFLTLGIFEDLRPDGNSKHENLGP